MRALVMVAVVVPGVAFADVLRITGIELEVEPTNAKGKPWDRAKGSIAEPDLVVKLRANGHKLTTCNAGDDSVKGYCQLDETIDVTPGTRIELEVFDDDDGLVSTGDKIGTGVIEGPSVAGPTTLPFEVKGQVKRAAITVEPVPTWFDNHRAGFAGLGLGILGALGLVGVFRNKLLVADPPPPAMPKCAHCSATVRKRDRRCFNCGAAL